MLSGEGGYPVGWLVQIFREQMTIDVFETRMLELGCEICGRVTYASLGLNLRKSRIFRTPLEYSLHLVNDQDRQEIWLLYCGHELVGPSH